MKDVQIEEILDVIEKVVNSNEKVTEKKRILKEMRERATTAINQAMDRVENGYKYCPKCKEWYREQAWETIYTNETREVCTFHDPCEFGEDKYENKECSIKIVICPIGHAIEEEVTW